MSDGDAPEATGLQAAINDSMAVVWRRYIGRRPTDVSTVVSGSRVECVLGDVVEQFAQNIDGGSGRETDGASDGETPDVAEGLTTTRYRRDAAAAVAKLTRRRVVAVISKHNESTDAATEIFILDAPARQRAPRTDSRRPEVSPS
jgi:hypothetical protein